MEVRWAHLALLVDFAFDLKKALQGINEQSFNHFVLKMGMSHAYIFLFGSYGNGFLSFISYPYENHTCHDNNNTNKPLTSNSAVTSKLSKRLADLNLRICVSGCYFYSWTLS